MKILVFDIETIPDIESGRKLHELYGDNISDKDVVRALEQLQFQKTGHTFLPHHLQKVVAISVLFVQKDEIKIRTLSGDEADVLGRFFNGIEQSTPKLVSWNGTNFDLPVLHYRALLHRVNAARYWEIGNDDRDFRYDNYLNRYHWRHIDLMDVLAAYNPRAYARLDEVSKMLGLPGKQIMGGSSVWDAYRQGKLQEIYNYCEIDVLNTFLIFLRFELMRGRLLEAEYQKHCDTLLAFIESADQKHFNDYVAEWKSQPSEPNDPEQAGISS